MGGGMMKKYKKETGRDATDETPSGTWFDKDCRKDITEVILDGGERIDEIIKELPTQYKWCPVCGKIHDACKDCNRVIPMLPDAEKEEKQNANKGKENLNSWQKYTKTLSMTDQDKASLFIELQLECPWCDYDGTVCKATGGICEEANCAPFFWAKKYEKIMKEK